MPITPITPILTTKKTTKAQTAMQRTKAQNPPNTTTAAGVEGLSFSGGKQNGTMYTEATRTQSPNVWPKPVQRVSVYRCVIPLSRTKGRTCELFGHKSS